MKPLRIHYKGKPVIYAHYHGRRLMMDAYGAASEGIGIGEYADPLVLPLKLGQAESGAAIGNSAQGLQHGLQLGQTESGAAIGHAAKAVVFGEKFAQVDSGIAIGSRAQGLNPAAQLGRAESGQAIGNSSDGITPAAKFGETYTGGAIGEAADGLLFNPVFGKSAEGCGIGHSARGVVFPAQLGKAAEGVGMGHYAEGESEAPPSPSEDTILTFRLTSELTQPIFLTQSSANAVTVDWGDGSATETSADTSAAFSHTYAAAGDYTVTVACEDGETWSPGASFAEGESSIGYCLLGKITGEKSPAFPTLISIVLGKNARLLRSSGLSHCTSITTIIIPNTITKIAMDEFNGCSSLTRIELPDTLSDLEPWAIRFCTALTEILIPEGVTADFYYTFQSDTALKNAALPNSVTMAESAFYMCSSLEHLTLGSGVTRITGIVDECTALKSLTCRAITPPTIGRLNNSNIPADCIFYVPAQSVSAYQAASGWSDRAAYIQAEVV